MIKFERVTFGYGEKQVLKDFSLEIENGAHLCLFGESGKGKTTLLRLICGLEKPQAGEITGIDKKRFSVVFQEDRLLKNLSVSENVALVGSHQKGDELLKKLGLDDYLDKKISDLSGGMRRRVAIARALCSDYDVLLLDEAFNGLDEDRIKDTAALILEETKGKTVVMITHSLEHAKLLNATVIHI
jgi:NitT/TauT family transport system ATP-binding protein